MEEDATDSSAMASQTASMSLSPLNPADAKPNI